MVGGEFFFPNLGSGEAVALLFDFEGQGAAAAAAPLALGRGGIDHVLAIDDRGAEIALIVAAAGADFDVPERAGGGRRRRRGGGMSS